MRIGRAAVLIGRPRQQLERRRQRARDATPWSARAPARRASRSLRALVISSSVTPSIAAWWIFVMIAKLPVGQPVDVVEALDDVHLPQRPAPVERSRVQPRHLDAELPPVARLRQRDVAHVVLEVEVGVLDPVRVVEPERHLHQPLAERARHVQAAADVLEDPLERDLAARARSTGRRSTPRRRGPERSASRSTGTRHPSPTTASSQPPCPSSGPTERPRH